MLQSILNKKLLILIYGLFLITKLSAFQLGNLDVPYQLTPAKIAEEVRFVAANNYQTFIIKNDNTLWLSGVKDYRDALPPSKINLLSDFVKIQDDVKEIAVCDENIMILKNDSSLFCMGNLPKEIESNSMKFQYVSNPIFIDSGVKKISVGNKCFIYVKEDGSTYYFGKLSYSSIGMSIEPKKIPYKSIDISTDRGSLFILTDNNELLSTSNGESFKKIDSNVIKISGNLFIKEDSSLFAFGNVTTGSLGVTVKSQDVPQFVMKDVKDVIFNYWHSLIIQNDGSLYSCGGIFGKPNSTTYSYMGFLGDGSGKPQLMPVKIAENVILGAVSDFTTFFITEDGSLWGCGLNNYDETVLYM